MKTIALLATALAVAPGRTSHPTPPPPPPVTLPPPSLPQVAFPGDPNSDIPCDDQIVTFSSWFCPIHPTTGNTP